MAAHRVPAAARQVGHQHVGERRLPRARLADHQRQAARPAGDRVGDGEQPVALAVAPDQPRGIVGKGRWQRWHVADARRQRCAIADVVAQDAALEVGEGGGGVEPELVGEAAPQRGDRGERLGLAARPVEREGEQAHRLLAQRLLADEGAEEVDDGARVGLHRGEGLDERAAQLGQPRDLRAGPRGVGELRQRAPDHSASASRSVAAATVGGSVRARRRGRRRGWRRGRRRRAARSRRRR